MSDDGNDKGGQTEVTEVVKAQRMYHCPFCERDEHDVPTVMFETEDELKTHLETEHMEQTSPKPKAKPSYVQVLDKAREKGAFTNYVMLVINPAGNPEGSIELYTSIIKDRTLEERLLTEKLIEVAFENRAILSGRVVPGPPGQPR